MNWFGDDPERTYKAMRRALAPAEEILDLGSRVVALLVLILYFPALLVVGLLVLMSSPGPALIKKAYRRRSGELVYLYEFRTEDWRRLQETWVGRAMRTADVHRLPRLINVLQGEVAVGERVRRANAA